VVGLVILLITITNSIIVRDDIPDGEYLEDTLPQEFNGVFNMDPDGGLASGSCVGTMITP